MSWPGLIEYYRDRLPVGDLAPVTLHEGNTPLIEVPRLAERLGLKATVYVKYEGLNPTCSFKDRGMTMAITMAVAEGATAVICASTGNTSASAAAYSARAGLDCFVIIPDGNIALGKLSQAVMHGAKVLAIQGNFDDAYRMVSSVAERRRVTVVNSINPYRLQGQKTAAFEICDALGRAPDYHVLPVGNAGNITAYWLGYTEYFDSRVTRTRPRMMGFQASGAAPIVLGHPITAPETVATAIRIGNPVSWKKAEAAREESGGIIDMVTDEEIMAAYKLLAATEGVFAEPASAASIAGLAKLADEEAIPAGAVVVCTLTGHGLKDPNNAIKSCPEPVRVPADLDTVLDVMGL
ncbi:MAG TPA: threonine synthase [Candidatus Binatia bacterium]|nr:threonine synthase [Candidatus Binatia bacterium]